MNWLSRVISIGCYIFILLASIIGLVIFSIRTVACCIHERKSSFQCQNFTLISHSLELEFIWLLIFQVDFAITLYFVSQVPGFIGWLAVYQSLIRLPNFWSFMYLLAIAVVECAVTFRFHQESWLQEAVVASFLTENIITVVIIGVLNLTQLKKIAQQFRKSVRVLIKLTLILFCISNFVMFMIGSIQLAFNVTGLDRKMSTKDDLKTIFGVVRSLANVLFYHKSAMFFWQKIFIDDRNILSYFQLLRVDGGIVLV